MPTLRAKPVLLQAHRLRYEDLYSEEPDTPDWVLDCIDSAELEPRRQEESFLLTHPDGSSQRLALGRWLGRTPAGRLIVLDDEMIAESYEVLG